MDDLLPDRAWIWIRQTEGGVSFNQADRGGRTAYGISERAHPEVWLNGAPTEAQARAIYARDYWIACQCHVLPEPLGLMLFDLAVQHGRRTATRIWQQALKIQADGLLGPKTVDAAIKANPTLLIDSYFPLRAEYYAFLAKADSSQAIFLLGWFGRLFRLERFLLREYRK